MAKQLLPNQHTPLHFVYGAHDCCLCRAENRILELEAENINLRKQLENAAHVKAEDPGRFDWKTLKIIDLKDLLRRIKEWDMLDVTADGEYWKKEIERVLRDTND